MTDIFISYAREDEPRIAPLARLLQDRGWQVFWDRNIPVGMSWEDHIEEHLEAADCVVVAWSEASVKSEWVRAEAREALDEKKLVPLFLDEVRPSLRFRGIQGAMLTDWRGDAVHAEFVRLISAIAALAGAADSAGSRVPDKPAASSRAAGGSPAFPVPEMKDIPAGEFRMGAQAGDGSERELPDHLVRIPQPLRLGKYPVTFQEFDAFAAATGREVPDDANWGRDRQPVVNVSWGDAVAYAQWLSSETGQRYRLPTEAEWEYAARAGTRTRFSFGDDEAQLGEHAWFEGKSGGGPHEVGTREPNPWGLHDMHGNVWEWVQDCWHETYENAPADGTVWEGEDGGDCGRRVVRGGSWYDVPWRLRSSNRDWGTPGDRNDGLGFRLAQDK